MYVQNDWNIKSYWSKSSLFVSDITILHCEDVEDFDTSIPLTNYLFNLCMLYNIFESERAMFINLKDVISSLELCLEREKNANVRIYFVSSVLLMYKKLS